MPTRFPSALFLTRVPHDIEEDLRWAGSCFLLPRLLGYPAEPERPQLAPRDRWRVWKQEGFEHGEQFELEQEFYYRIIDWPLKKVFKSYMEEMTASYGGTDFNSKLIESILFQDAAGVKDALDLGADANRLYKGVHISGK